MLHTQDIQIRDPFILRVEQDNLFYMFGTTDTSPWSGPGVGFNCYSSADLEHWNGPFTAFTPPQDFWGETNFWAPEVKQVGERFYMTATFCGRLGERGTAILVSDNPAGPYIEHSTGPVTPQGWICLDGTLFEQDRSAGEGAETWLVFCREWTEVLDGQMYTVQLNRDLTQAVGEPHLLFSASQAPWARGFTNEITNGQTGFVTDGPFIHRATDGSLLMMWSSFGNTGYAIGIARSDSGKVTGPWSHLENPMWPSDGGHGMLFYNSTGKLHLSLHAPNATPQERPAFRAVREIPDPAAPAKLTLVCQ